MKVLANGCRIFAPADGQVSKHGNWTERAVVRQSSGSKRITQSIHEFAPGCSPAFVNQGAEEVLYVAAGVGTCLIGGYTYGLRPGAAVYVPPGVVCEIGNGGLGVLRIISSRCPEEGSRQIGAPLPPPAMGDAPRRMVHEEEREQIRAGQDRIFRYMVHTDLGCLTVTQFIGWIPASKAPFHSHEYEEVIYVLEGRGILHLTAQDAGSEFGPGSSIYLPAGVAHCLENPGPAPIRLLGAFYPSGSPGAAYED